MNRILPGALSLLALTASLLPAQAPARKPGTIFKDEIDQLVAALRRRVQSGDDAGPLGGASVLATAQILCAMGHCHRFYHASDGPVVRPSLTFLIRARAADGSYGQGDDQAAATAWVADALQVMDADGFRDEIATAQTWLRRHGAAASRWSAAVAAVLAAVRTDVFPQHLAADAVALVPKIAADPAAVPVEAAAQALVRLVACQAANRQLDKGQGPAVTAWSPAQQKGFEFLLASQKDGVFSAVYGGRSFPDPAITGFGLLALQTKPRAQRSKKEQETIDLGLGWLLEQQNEDGSWGQQVQNYTTSVVVGALARWGDAAARPALDKAQKFILACQNAEQTGYQSSDRDYGSVGYSNSQRGDLSNLNFALQALRDSGLSPDHESFAKALVFLQRTQNLKSVNDFTGKVPDPDNEGRIIDATSGDDGGAAYYPGNSAAGYVVQPDGKSVPRSYGSMTYALLKSYTLCGIKADDPRVQAAVKWIQANWTLAENPGSDPALGAKIKYQGLFYYYMVLAQALDLAGVEQVTTTDEKGAPQSTDWRQALRTHLEGMQLPGGAWLNDKNERWMEGFDVLCTCYALVALEHCR